MTTNEISKNTILNHEMKAATSPDDAWRTGDAYFFAGEEERYKVLTKDSLEKLLRSAHALQKENGLLYLYEDPTMPGDARVDIIYKPSYTIAAVAIFAYQQYPEIFDAELSGFLCYLLEGAFQYGIVGHGIDSFETVRRTMLMLCKAGMRMFLEKNQEQYPIFAEKMHSHMESFQRLGRKIDEEGCIVTENGFSRESINHLIKQLIACWNGYNRPVFVYGTLMKGERANGMLTGCEYAGKFLLKDYAMYHLGSYPGIKPCIGETVIGELYFVNDDIAEQLDRYEGEGYLYDRTNVTLYRGRKALTAEVYVYKQDVSGCKMMREAWNASEEDLVWYAGYGSNLSSERFACYISGGICKENGRSYLGASDKTTPRAIELCSYPGRMYFGNSSSSWNGCGVAFYDPSYKEEGDTVYMKRYLITSGQMHDVMRQEGMSASWYGRLICLDIDDQGIPVYTITSEKRRPENAPDPAYVELIGNVLEKEFKFGKRKSKGYLNKCQRSK